LFDAVFKYGDGEKFWSYAMINAEPLYVEFSNFVQCHIFVNYLTFAVNEWNIKNIIKLRLPEIQLLAIVRTQLKFRRSWRTYNSFVWNIILYVGVLQYGNRVTH
jgi:hypothetical protein